MRGFSGLCDMIYSPQSFHVVGSFILKIIWGAWKKFADLVQWHFSGRLVGWDLTRRLISFYKVQGTCIGDIHLVQGMRLRKNKIFF